MRTTKKDFERCEKSFRLWQGRLSLMEWRACFEHGKVTDAYAEIFANPEGRIATVIFADACSTDGAIGYDPVHTGRHEALELLLAPLKEIARARNFSEADLDAAIHAVIRRLENLFDGMEGNG